MRSGAVIVALAALAAGAHAKAPRPVTAKRFDTAAQAALQSMRVRAAALGIQGVAVVAFAPGETVQSWSSEMAVVGHMTDHTNGEKGNNLLAIAYAKASEMANTLKNSGEAGTLPMTGEFGWQGGVVQRTPRGLLVVAFSGGKSEDDVQVSREGLRVLDGTL